MIQTEWMQNSSQCLVKYIIMNHTLYILYMYAVYTGISSVYLGPGHAEIMNVSFFMGLNESQVEVLLRKVRLHRQHL